MTQAELDVQYGEYRLRVADHFGIHPAEVTAEHSARFDALAENEAQ